MKISGIFWLISFLATIGMTLAFPFYLLDRLRIWKRLRAHKIGAKATPSIWTLLIYVLLVALVLSLLFRNFIYFEWKSKMSEAKTELGAIYNHQREYFSATNTYAGGKQAFELLGWTPSSQHRYTYYCGDQIVSSSFELNPDPRFSVADWPLTITPQSSAQGFTAMAIGNLDNDPFLDVWMINDKKGLTHLLDDTNDAILADIFIDRASRHAPILPLQFWLSDVDNQVLLVQIASMILMIALAIGLYYDYQRYRLATKERRI
jgi:type IV pilus assembly protein PilA